MDHPQFLRLGATVWIFLRFLKTHFPPMILSSRSRMLSRLYLASSFLPRNMSKRPVSQQFDVHLSRLFFKRHLGELAHSLKKLSLFKDKRVSPYLSALDFWKIKLNELDFLSFSNLIFAGYTGVKFKFEIDKKIKFIQLDFSNSIFQKSSADQMWGSRGHLRTFGDYEIIY